MNIRQLAKEQEDYVIKCRHYLHAHPELGEHEVETTRYIREQLEEMGIPVQDVYKRQPGICIKTNMTCSVSNWCAW